jgi:hypothetical protein
LCKREIFGDYPHRNKTSEVLSHARPALHLPWLHDGRYLLKLCENLGGLGFFRLVGNHQILALDPVP